MSWVFADRAGVLCVAHDNPPRSYPMFHGPRLRCAADGMAHPYFPGSVIYTGSRWPSPEARPFTTTEES